MIPRLNVNIDHIATIRQARRGTEPCPVQAAQIAVLAGADGIVAHLREDRRHINDRDVRLIRELVDTKFDLEMAATDEIIEIALDIVPDLVTIVPEKREELTTEGGLDVAKDVNKYKVLTNKMHAKNIKVSYFIEPEEKQVLAAIDAGADMVEFHTGNFAKYYRTDNLEQYFSALETWAAYAESRKIEVVMGHGINYNNIKKLLEIRQIDEISIGHSIISRASLVGLDRAVRDMKEIILNYY